MTQQKEFYRERTAQLRTLQCAICWIRTSRHIPIIWIGNTAAQVHDTVPILGGRRVARVIGEAEISVVAAGLDAWARPARNAKGEVGDAGGGEDVAGHCGVEDGREKERGWSVG